MRLLLDTHALIWFDSGDERLSTTARERLDRSDSEIYLSIATVWEMAIKAGTGRLRLPEPIREYVVEKMEAGLRLLPIEWQHAAAVESLPHYHRDPFDRLLVAQALAEKLPIVTGDPSFRPYGITVIW